MIPSVVGLLGDIMRKWWSDFPTPQSHGRNISKLRASPCAHPTQTKKCVGHLRSTSWPSSKTKFEQ